MKKINPNNEVNAKILQILDECENDIAAANRMLEKFDNEWQEESWDVENNNPYFDDKSQPSDIIIGLQEGMYNN